MATLESYVRRVQSPALSKPQSTTISTRREDGARLARGGGAVIRPRAQGLPDPASDAIGFGQIAFFAFYLPPPGWIACAGQQVTAVEYPRFFEFLSAAYGYAEATFTLPDLRGEFVRGLDTGRGVDAGREPGSSQPAQLVSHEHQRFTGVVQNGDGQEVTVLVPPPASPLPWSFNDVTETPAPSGDETRPRNVALLACMRVA